jgi:hypothetical protein
VQLDGCDEAAVIRAKQAESAGPNKPGSPIAPSGYDGDPGTLLRRGLSAGAEPLFDSLDVLTEADDDPSPCRRYPIAIDPRDLRCDH